MCYTLYHAVKELKVLRKRVLEHKVEYFLAAESKCDHKF